MEKNYYTIYSGFTGTTSYDLPIHLEESIQQLGIMSSFDGDIGQLDQFCNFTYSGNSMTVKIFNTVNTNIIGQLIESIFTISWGDGSPDTNIGMPIVNVDNHILPYTGHTYSSPGTYTIEITVDSPWEVRTVKKQIKVPFITPQYPTSLGQLTFTIPYSEPTATTTQKYLQDYRTLTGATNPAKISFLGIGKSRIDELKKYGNSLSHINLTLGTDTDGTSYTGYTIDDMFYMDRTDGLTHITGTTSGTTINFFQDEIYNGMITRNEHFLGFVEDMTIYSDVFVERGKVGVMERNLRLTEIGSTGEIQHYGNGFFKIEKQ